MASAAVMARAGMAVGRSMGVSNKTRSSRSRSRCTAVRARAKYTPQESQYFDLDDLENTVGAWDVYGKDSPNRYPALQADAFEKFTAPFQARRTLFSFLAIGAIATAVLYGVKGEGDASLPIIKGPQTPKEQQVVVNGRQ